MLRPALSLPMAVNEQVGFWVVGDTISTPGRAKAAAPSRQPMKRQVRTVRAWEYQQPLRFQSSRSEAGEVLIVVLRGQLGVLLFLAEGKLVQPVRLGGKGQPRQIKIPANTFYTVLSLSPEAAILEVQPSTLMGVRAQWLASAPVANSPDAKEQWRRWVSYFAMRESK